MGFAEWVNQARDTGRPEVPKAEDFPEKLREPLKPLLEYLADLETWFDDLASIPVEGEEAGAGGKVGLEGLTGGPGIMVAADEFGAGVAAEEAADVPRGMASGENLVELMALKVSGTSGTGYTWDEVEPTAGGGWNVKEGGRNNTDDGLAYAADNWAEITAGTYILAVGLAIAATGVIEWRFMAPLPYPGTTQYKGIHVNASNRLAVDWTRVH